MPTNFKRTFGNATSPLALSYLDDNFSQLEAAGTSTVSLSGAQLIGYMQSGSGAVSTTVQNEIRQLHFNVKGFGATGDGTTDDSSAIQAAIDAAETAGGKVWFPLGAYNLGTTGISIIGNGVVLEGQTPRFVGSSLFGVEFLYSGTGVAVTFGQSGTIYYRNGLNNIQIRATGGATSSATAVGLKLINQHYLQSFRAAIKDFESGTGWLAQPAGANMFGATCTFYDLLIHLCKVGIQSIGSSAVIKDNHCIFIGGAVLQSAQPAGSIGVDLQQYSDCYLFYGTDVEGYETGWKLDGGNHQGISTRSEDCTTHVSFTTNSTGCHFPWHSPQGSGTPVSDTSTARSNTFIGSGSTDTNIYRGKWRVKPFADATEVLAVENAAGTIYLDVSTSGSPRMEAVNGLDVVGYSDSFSTEKWRITGSSGAMSSASSIKSSSATAGIGYATGAGGSVTQETSKATAVELNKIAGRITTHNANLAAGTAVGFSWTNSTIAATDVVVTNPLSGTSGAYHIEVIPGAGSASVYIRNLTAGDLAEAITIAFVVIKGVVA